MATVESIAPVIDFEALLNPISDEAPSGESLQYAGVYDEIREARRADDATLSQGDWQTEAKTADFRKVIDLATNALTSQTKDIQIAAWLCEALVMEYGFAGLRDGLRLVKNLHENFWDSVYPEIDEGDMEGRANAIDWLNTQVSLVVKANALIANYEGASYSGWEDAKRFDFPEDISHLESEEFDRITALKNQAEKENRLTGEKWRKAYNLSRRAFYEELSLTLSECTEELKGLDLAIENTYDRKQMPGLSTFKKTLEDISDLVGKFLKEKRQQEPDPEDFAEEGGESVNGEATGPGGVAGMSGPIKSRQDALTRLSQVADFFRKTEPHSPVAYLVQRAVKWGNMPLDSWLREVVKDEGVLGQLQETLGLGAGGYSSDSYSSSDSWGDSSSESTEESSDSSW